MKSLRRGLGVEGVFWARWRDGGGGCKWCKHSGLVHKSGKAKPAWGAYRKFLKTLPPPPPPSSDPDPAFYGVAPDGPLSAADLALMDQAGVGAVRAIVSWRAVQPTDGAPYDWQNLDDKFEALALHGIEILPQLTGPPDTVSNIDDQAMLGNWKAFVSAAVNRYKPGGDFWDQFAAAHPAHRRYRRTSGRSTTSRTSTSTGPAGPPRTSTRSCSRRAPTRSAPPTRPRGSCSGGCTATRA